MPVSEALSTTDPSSYRPRPIPHCLTWNHLCSDRRSDRPSPFFPSSSPLRNLRPLSIWKSATPQSPNARRTYRTSLSTSVASKITFQYLFKNQICSQFVQSRINVYNQFPTQWLPDRKLLWGAIARYFKEEIFGTWSSQYYWFLSPSKIRLQGFNCSSRSMVNRVPGVTENDRLLAKQNSNVQRGRRIRKISGKWLG